MVVDAVIGELVSAQFCWAQGNNRGFFGKLTRRPTFQLKLRRFCWAYDQFPFYLQTGNCDTANSEVVLREQG